MSEDVESIRNMNDTWFTRVPGNVKSVLANKTITVCSHMCATKPQLSVDFPLRPHHRRPSSTKQPARIQVLTNCAALLHCLLMMHSFALNYQCAFWTELCIRFCIRAHNPIDNGMCHSSTPTGGQWHGTHRFWFCARNGKCYRANDSRVPGNGLTQCMTWWQCVHLFDCWFL